MKKIQLLLLTIFVTSILSAQTIEELKSMKAEKAEAAAALQLQVDAINGEISGIDAQITELTGWTTGVNGLIGFDLVKSNKWIANPNPVSSSSSLNIGITTFANKDQAKYFWNNKGIIQKAWQDVDTPAEIDDAGQAVKDKLFDQGTVDILNISSLAGYKLTKNFALSGLGELNTSIGNFLEPGTADLGIGATWLPTKGMTVVIHPLNYHIAWSPDGDTSSEGALGAKVRADYGRDLKVLNKNVGWNTTFTTFFPYGSNEPSLFEYTWLNTLSFELWRGLGVGIGFGFRQADFEASDVQSFYSTGLSYGF